MSEWHVDLSKLVKADWGKSSDLFDVENTPRGEFHKTGRDPYYAWERFDRAMEWDLDPSDWKQRLDKLRALQKKFNEASGTYCSGLMGRLRWKGGDDMASCTPMRTTACHKRLCPSCWFVSMNKIGVLVQEVEAPVWYVRATHWADYPKLDNPAISEALLNRFKAHGTKYMQVAWALVFEPNDDRLINDTDRLQLCRYRYVGIFVSDRLIGDQLACRGGNIGSGRGVIDRWVFDNREDALLKFSEETTHPGLLCEFPDYAEYIAEFNPQERRMRGFSLNRENVLNKYKRSKIEQ